MKKITEFTQLNKQFKFFILLYNTPLQSNPLKNNCTFFLKLSIYRITTQTPILEEKNNGGT